MHDWGPAQDEAFSQVKEELSKLTILALYDPQSPTKISAGASSYGLGAVLLQGSNDNWRPVTYASWYMSEMEKQYARIEKEVLATTCACEKFTSCVLGMHILCLGLRT